MCMCLARGGWRCCRKWVGGLDQGLGGVGWCYACVSCESGLFVMMAGPGICIFC